ncbi:MAG: hypothetical protein DRO73_00060 [Candidatus Thorarchaeota archaeon]|nr:MAG: hypothetical protein DRO73_00060 [Candidatus Thorarchaeota archaeon]RLI60524.1 MAG: hypothetical protein DRO93_06810 [Candidatus Thorarchaeota archaeon]
MEARIAHVSDTHLGFSPREGVKQNVWGEEMRSRLLENDFYERFAEVFDRIAAMDPPVDLVVHSGDLYDSPWDKNPSQPPVVAQETAIAVLQKFTARTGVPVLIIEGNHGLYRTRDVSLLDLLRISVPNVHVATQVDLKRAFSEGKPLKFSFDKLDVFCFPFIERAVLESADLMQKFNEWISEVQKPSRKRISVAVSHGMELDRSLYTEIFTHHYEYVALGHDHRQRKLYDNAWYAGSPERWRFDEAGLDKGFLVVTLHRGEMPSVERHLLEFRRPVFNERINVKSQDTPQSVVERVRAWFEEKGLRASWDPDTAARVRLRFEGATRALGSIELAAELDALRSEILREGSEYNVAQFVWAVRVEEREHNAPAYSDIESEYLIENPEQDFREYLGTLEVDPRYDPELLTKIAVRALEFAVSGTEEHLTIDTLEEDEA